MQSHRSFPLPIPGWDPCPDKALHQTSACPQGTLAPGAPSPDMQKVKYEFHPSRHFNDFTWELKKRRETERSRTSCLVTKGERRRGWEKGIFIFFSFFFFYETVSPLSGDMNPPLQHLWFHIPHRCSPLQGLGFIPVPRAVGRSI